MAKYEITHTCGCKKTYQIIGPYKKRDSKIAWLESKKCFDCERAERNAKNAEKVADLDLPALSGVSEKQIAYATDVRAEVLADIRKREEILVAQIVEAFEDCSETCARRALREELEYLVANATEARGWLDNRHRVASLLLQSAIDHAVDIDDDDDDNDDGAEAVETEPTIEPVDVNNADASALRSIRGVGRVLSARIAAFIASLGRALESLDELLAVRGIGTKTLEKIRAAATC